MIEKNCYHNEQTFYIYEICALGDTVDYFEFILDLY
jgi:hypothetical protein